MSIDQYLAKHGVHGLSSVVEEMVCHPRASTASTALAMAADLEATLAEYAALHPPQPLLPGLDMRDRETDGE